MPNYDDLEASLMEATEDDVFRDRLWDTAENLVNQYGFSFSSGCEFLLRSFIVVGINRMDEEDRLSDVVSLELAEANLTVFVSRMVIAALMQNSSELDEDIFQSLEAAFAVWPFYRGGR